MPDGSVYARVTLDDADAVKELENLKVKIQKLQDELNSKKARKSEIEKQMDAANASVEETRKRVEALKAALASAPRGEKAGLQSDLKIATAEYNQQVKEMDALNKEWIKLDAEIPRGEEQLKAMEGSAANVVKQIAASDSVMAKLASATQKAGKKMEAVFGRVKRAVERVFVYSVILAGLRALREYFMEVVKATPEASEALGKLQGALLTLAQPIIEVAIPAFVWLINIITQATTALASFFAALSGKSLKETAESASELYNEAKGLDKVGASAKKASKQLLVFDEINKLSDSDVGGSGGASSTIAPIFNGEANDFGLGDLLASFVVKIKDVLFKWDNVTPRDIVNKIATAIFGIAGALIGWKVGGLAGAAIGAVIGASIGLFLVSAIFEKGEARSRLLLLSVVGVLGALTGGTIGFTLGGFGGAVIGASIGTAITLFATNALFSTEKAQSNQNLIASLVLILGVIAGGLIGFKIGGLAGAPIGVAVAAGIIMSIDSAMFSSNKNIQQYGLIKALATVLTAIAGGVMGFAVGGVPGAAIGVVIGVGISLVIQSIDWQSNVGKVLRNSMLTLPALGVTTTINGMKIPGLATGAVIPPNREFLAVLGDQKSGTNIEAPLDTIVQAFRTALNEQGGGRHQTIQLVCDKRVFAELTYDMYNLRSGQLGVKLGGGAK